MSTMFKKGFITFDFILASLVCLALLSSMMQYAKGLEDTSDIHLFRATTKAYTEHTAHIINTVVADQIGQVDSTGKRMFVLGDRFPFPVAADYNLHSCFVWMEENGILVVKSMVKKKDKNIIINDHPAPTGNSFKYPSLFDSSTFIKNYTTTIRTPVTSLATLYNTFTDRECKDPNTNENDGCFCNALKITSKVIP